MVAPFFSLVVPNGALPKPDTSWIGNLAGSVGGAIDEAGQQKSFNGLADRIGGGQPQQQSGGFLSRLMGGGQPQEASAAPTGRAPVAPVTRSVIPNGSQQDFINSILPAAIEEGKRTGVDPRIIVAQAAQETGWGKSAPGNNLFGIKSHGQAGGNSLMTTEYVNGSPVQERASFRGYDSPEDSVRGYGDFITQNPRYADFRNAQGLDAQLSALQASGYATDPNYSRSVGAIARGIQLPGGPTGPTNAADAVNAMAGGNMPSGEQPLAFAEGGAPQAQGGGGNQIAAGVTPVTRGSVDPSMIQFMLRDPNLRETGLKLWAANAQGQNPTEAWQFINLPDGTLARANQQTGAVEKIGQFAKPAEEKSLINLGDGRLFDPNNREVIDAGGGRKKAPNIVELFDEQTGQPYKARWDEGKGEFERVGGVKARSGMSLTTNPDGTVTLTEGSVGNMPKLTDAEGRSTGFYGRGLDSQKTLNDLESQGTSLWNNTAGQLPKVGNFLRSEDAQKYDQAKRNFINAVLRRESGAVISPEEFANADQQYFPQPGDGSEVIAQKRRNRETTIQGLKVSSGQGANFALPPDQQGQQLAPAPQNGSRKTSTGVQWSIEE
jgi:hypothetical protein